jgi:hypothetical protein
MSPATRRAWLDRPAARLCAIAVFLLCAGALAYLHRNELRPRAAPETAAADDPVAACQRDRLAVIDGQLRDGVLKPEQAELFRARVDALCQAQSRKSAPEGLPPGMAPTPLPSR